MKLKYVMFDGCLPVVFGEYFEHKDAKMEGKPTSAGNLSIDFENKTVNTYGQSIGLNLCPNRADARILGMLFFSLD